MPANHTDVDQFPTVVKPSDGDVATVASVRQAQEPLADRTFWLRNRLLGGIADGKLRIPLVMVKNVNNRFTFQTPGGSSTSWVWQQTDVTDGGDLFFALPQLFIRGTISKITAYVHGKADSGAVHAGMPATMPRITLVPADYTVITAAGSVFSWQNDPSGSLGAYESDHVIELAGLAEVLNQSSNRALYARIQGETGANAAANKFAIGAVIAEIDPN